MKKKTVTLAAAVILLAVLCGTYAGVSSYVSKQEQKKETEGEEEKATIASIPLEDMTTISFMIEKKEAVFEKKEEKWVKKDEAEFPVNQDKVDQAAGSFSELKAERVLEDVKDLSEYGLDSPENTITVSTEDKESLSIQIGMENEGVSQYYVKKNDDDTKVYLVASASIQPFMNSLYDYAQSGAFPEIGSDKIKEIQVTGEKAYTLSEDENNLWNISNGTEMEKADSAKAGSVASAISTLEYASFVDYNASSEKMKQYGLEEPYAEVTVKYEEEVEEENTKEETEPEMVSRILTLHIGGEAGEESRYVSVDESREVYTISNESLSAIIGKEASDFWDMNICYVSVNDLDEIRVEHKGETKTINVSRETSEDSEGNKKETMIYKCDGESVDSTLFQTFYNKLVNMSAQKRVTEKAFTEKEPEIRIYLKKTSGTETEVSFYGYDNNFYGVCVDEKIYMVNKVNVKELISSYEKLMESEKSEA